jgi:hypothetical protein
LNTENSPVHEELTVDPDGIMHHNLTITDPAGLRRVIALNLNHVPGFYTDDPDYDAPMEDADAAIPSLIIESVSALDNDDESSRIDVFVVSPEDVNRMVGNGINMFTQDGKKTERIVALINLMMGNEVEVIDNTGVVMPKDDEDDAS